MAFSDSSSVLAQVPYLSSSEKNAKTFTQNLVSNAVRDVLEEHGCYEAVSDAVRMATTHEITAEVNYLPLRCAAVLVNPMPSEQLKPSVGDNKKESCLIFGSTVKSICPPLNNTMPQTCQSVGGTAAISVPSQFLTIAVAMRVRNTPMANWSLTRWRILLSKIPRRLFSSYGTNFSWATVTVS
uniref:TAF domain-containing protein n=1 Tax=Angiostrongylus cantonensis TaxID=6313 RepID=A0A0K0CWN7_ANGCA